MNLETVINCEISYDKKRFLTRPDFQASFNCVTVDKDDGRVIHESISTKGLYALLKEHFHYLNDQQYCNLMYLLGANTYNTLTIFWAKNEKGISDSLEELDRAKKEFKLQDQIELSKFLVKLFSHPEQSLVN